MSNQIFVNLPVENLDKTKDFFSQLGYSFDPKFTDDKGACLVLGENIYAMLLTKNFFKTFIKKTISDSQRETEVIVALSVESKDKINEMVNKAIMAGGKTYSNPSDQEWMYSWGFQDLDGHLWELVYMDESKRKKIVINLRQL